jgi:hypothetical protein
MTKPRQFDGSLFFAEFFRKFPVLRWRPVRIRLRPPPSCFALRASQDLHRPDERSRMPSEASAEEGCRAHHPSLEAQATAGKPAWFAREVSKAGLQVLPTTESQHARCLLRFDDRTFVGDVRSSEMCQNRK